MDISLSFQPGQIVSLAQGDQCLYAEVIQVVVSRHLCWVRPLLLVTFTEETPIITDLQDASDILWPVDVFRPALDTEVMTLLSQVLAKDSKPGTDSDVKHQLNQFIHQVWEAHKIKN